MIPGPVIGDPVPARLPLECRRGVREMQGQRAPSCSGVLKADLESIRRMIEMGGSPGVSCPACGLRHGFALGADGILYGALL